MKTCPHCNAINPDSAAVCDCGKLFDSSAQVRYPQPAGIVIQAKHIAVAAVGLVAIAVIFSIVRVYHGDTIGVTVVAKPSPSFTDTLVNLDDILAMPRIAVAAQHPSVKRQLEEMGIIKTDKQVQEETRQKVQAEMEAATRKAEEEQRRLMKRMGY